MLHTYDKAVQRYTNKHNIEFLININSRPIFQKEEFRI